MFDSKKQRGKLPWNGSNMMTEAARRPSGVTRWSQKLFGKQSPPVDSNLSTAEVQAHFTPALRLRAEDDGSAWPGSTEERTVDSDRPILDGLKTSRSTELLSPATSRDPASNLNGRLEIEAKEDARTATVTIQSTATNITSEQGFGVLSASNHFTSATSSSFELETKQPAPSRDARANLEYSTLAYSSESSTANLFGKARSTCLGDRTTQGQEFTTVLSQDPFVSNPCEAAMLAPERDADLAANSFSQSYYCDPTAQSDRLVGPSNVNVHSQPILDDRHLDNSLFDGKPRSGHLVESKTPMEPNLPGTLVCTSEKDINKCGTALRAEGQLPQGLGLHQLRNPSSSPAVEYNLPSSTLSRGSSPTIVLQLSDAVHEECDSQICPSVPLPAAPYTPLRSASTRPSHGEEGNGYFDSSPAYREESGLENEICGHGSMGPSTEGSGESVSTAPWNWIIATDRGKLMPTFYWIVKKICPPLTLQENTEGYICAFRTKEPKGRKYLKIGFAASIETKKKKHESCYGSYEQIYPPEEEEPVKVNHAARVEGLIHAELVQQAMELELCPGDNRVHGKVHDGTMDWFDVDDRQAIAVIRKWSEWIGTAPYEELPLTEKIVRKTPEKRRASAGSPAARLPKTETSNGKPPKTSAKPPVTTTWRLRESQSLMEICRPLDVSATMMGDKDINDVGTGVLQLNLH